MEELLFGGIRMRYHESQFRVSTDSVLAADFVRPRADGTVCDLGCGCGAISLLLLGSHPGITVTGIELQPDAAACARQNALENGLENRFHVIAGDLREYRTLFSPCSFSSVVCNPPYYPVSSGYHAQSPALAAARTELTCTLNDVCACAAWLLKTAGSFTLVHKPERLADLICSLREHALEPKRVRFVRHSSISPVNLVLLEARKGGRPGLDYEPDLILFSPDGAETAEYQRIYHRQEA